MTLAGGQRHVRDSLGSPRWSGEYEKRPGACCTPRQLTAEVCLMPGRDERIVRLPYRGRPGGGTREDLYFVPA